MSPLKVISYKYIGFTTFPPYKVGRSQTLFFYRRRNGNLEVCQITQGHSGLATEMDVEPGIPASRLEAFLKTAICGYGRGTLLNSQLAMNSDG